jgi:UPF0176 protein
LEEEVVEQNVNISAYKFINLEATNLPVYREKLLSKAILLGMKGSILLSTEGINVFLSAPRQVMDEYIIFLESYEEFRDLPYKDSFSDYQPFRRMLVRIKKEIISMGCEEIKPAEKTAPHVSVQEFKRWYDEGKDMVVLDTRNDYEVQLGTFDSAVDLDIKTFRAFPEAVKLMPDEVKEKPVVTFCTGGIRCEKAAEYMLGHGFKNVYQLDGGILKYFEECGGEHYDGDCFVFDQRVCLDSDLNETDVTQCFVCRMPLTVEQVRDDQLCLYCGGNAVMGKKVSATGEQAA